MSARVGFGIHIFFYQSTHVHKMIYICMHVCIHIRFSHIIVSNAYAAPGSRAGVIARPGIGSRANIRYTMVSDCFVDRNNDDGARMRVGV